MVDREDREARERRFMEWAASQDVKLMRERQELLALKRSYRSRRPPPVRRRDEESLQEDGRRANELLFGPEG